MKVTICSKDNCGYCTKAIQLAKEKKVDLQVLKLDVDFTMEWLHSTFPTARTFPQIIVDGENIGGYTEFKELFKNWREGTIWECPYSPTEDDEPEDLVDTKTLEQSRKSESQLMQDNLEPIYHPTQYDESDDLEDAKVIVDEYRKLSTKLLSRREKVLLDPLGASQKSDREWKTKQ